MIEPSSECAETVMNNGDSVEETLDDVAVDYTGLAEVHCYWSIAVANNY